jgi:two-component system phosphate regulon sensor histidine kinase PhoR
LVLRDLIWFNIILNLLVGVIVGTMIYKQFHRTKFNQKAFFNGELIHQDNLVFETIFSPLDQYLMIVNQDGKIIHLTKPWIDLLNIKNKLDNLNLKKLIDLSPKFWSMINKVLATEKKETLKWEVGPKVFQSSILPIRYHQKFYGVIVTANDITKIEQLEKIQSDFLADISHEIKTPIAAIIGASEILNQRERKLSFKQRQEFQGMIASESARLQRLIDELTDLSRIGTHGFQTLIKSKFLLLTLIDEVLKLFQIEQKKKGVKIVIEVPSNLEIFADRDKFFLILANLLSNAIRYTDQGLITISSKIHDQSLIIQVKDTGQGIEPNNLERIFDRFYRTDMARSRIAGGTGLGLAITRAIIQAHQGTIHAQSELEKGTTFTITLPHLRQPNKT